ncbi:MAG: hypothetical protein ACE361_08990 [Aureliella sp.]
MIRIPNSLRTPFHSRTENGNGNSQRQARQKASLTALAFLAICGVATACNIPVFRYALERWKSDTYEVLIFHGQNFDRQASEPIRRLQAQADRLGNISMSFVNLDSMSAEQSATWKRLGTAAESSDIRNRTPYVVLQTRLRQKPLPIWQGALSDFETAGLLASPARQQIASRLLTGDSVVWVLLLSENERANANARAVLKDAFEQLESRVRIPEGVGLPGSELFSEIPLLVQFNTVEIEHDAPNEVFFRRLCEQLQPDHDPKSEPFIVPVFGRGRALEVIPGSQLNTTTIEELTLFLSGPCSCQVKDQNPGFDLLFSVDWDRELFGEASERPPVRAVSDPQSSPRMLTIPPGSKPRR